MKSALALLALALSFPAFAAAPADLYRCELTQAIPGYLPETLVGYLAPSDTRRPAEGQLHVFPNIHFRRGEKGLDGVVYGFHGGNRPGSRLLVQLLDEEGLQIVGDYHQNTPERVAVSHVREKDKASFELACVLVR